MPPSTQGRDERVAVHSTGPIQSNKLVNARFAGGVPAPPAHRGSAVNPDAAFEDAVAAPPPQLRRVVEDKVVSFKMPGTVSFRGRLRAGKILSSEHYDFEDLKNQGVKLVKLDEENVVVKTDTGTSAAQLGDLLDALASRGLIAVPRGDSDELAELKRKLAKAEEQLAESAKKRS